jgi:ATP-dependent protease HslVU (ClpYQ) peptidase subunit
MTAIVGLVDKGKVYIGGDSAGAGGYHLQIRADEKVFRNGPFLFGFTTSFRMGQLLRYAFAPPKHDSDMSDYAYLVTAFVDGIRACLKAGGYNKTKEGEENGGTFLLGYRGHLYKVADDYQVAESADNFDACGCGQPVALGALYATDGEKPEKRVRKALKAAERFNTDVRGPFVVEVLE